MQVWLGLKYADSVGPLGWDLFAPDGGGPWPLVVFIHGGGWISGDRTMYRDEAAWWVDEGFAAACIDYRLAPLYPWPHPAASVQAFFRQSRESGFPGFEGPRFSHVFAMGNSAGGHLALMAGLCPADLMTGVSARRADAVAAICPITDLRHPVEDGFDLSIEYVVQLMGGSLDGRSAELTAASPMAYCEMPVPVFIACGDEDDIVPDSQSLRMANALADAELLLLPGEGHTFTFSAWQTIRARARDFFRHQVGS